MTIAATRGTGPFAPFEWMLALRYLRARRKEGFISVIAGFSFIGIMLGVATLIIVLSVMNGFRKELFDKILGLNGHVIIRPLARPFTDYAETAARLDAVAGVKHALPVVEGQVMVSTQSSSSGIIVRGIRSKDLDSLKAISSNVRFGTFENFDESGGVAIGTRLANSLNVFVGGEITLLAPRGATTPFGTAPRVKRYPVVAIFEMGMSEYDGTIAFLPLKEAQSFFNVPNAVHVLEVVVDHPDNVDEMRTALQNAAGPDMLLNDWRQRNATFYNTLKVERNVMFIILMLIVLVAALNIVSGLTMLVKDKGRDVAVLRTMGATRGAIMRVFFITGASIGVVGTLAGFLIGVAICNHIEEIRQFISALTNTSLFPSQVYFLSKLPAEIDTVEVATVVGAALVLSMAATIYPAMQAAPARSCGGIAIPMTAMAREFSGTRPALQIVDLERTFFQGDKPIQVLRGASADIFEGEIVALVGPSGSGKSSLLHMIGLLEKPGGGTVLLDGIDCTSLSDSERTRVRRTEIGFVYQFHNLLPEFSALENVMMPQLIAGVKKRAAKDRALELLSGFGLADRAVHRPAELSGGEQQRVAIARAVANGPRVLLADEPTGNLDPQTAERVFDELLHFVRATGVAALLATHNFDIARRMDRVLQLDEGVLIEALVKPAVSQVKPAFAGANSGFA